MEIEFDLLNPTLYVILSLTLSVMAYVLISDKTNNTLSIILVVVSIIMLMTAIVAIDDSRAETKCGQFPIGIRSLTE